MTQPDSKGVKRIRNRRADKLVPQGNPKPFPAPKTSARTGAFKVNPISPRSQLEVALSSAATRGQGKGRTPSLPRLRFLEHSDD